MARKKYKAPAGRRAVVAKPEEGAIPPLKQLAIQVRFRAKGERPQLALSHDVAKTGTDRFRLVRKRYDSGSLGQGPAELGWRTIVRF